ncbi:MAG: ABC transporter substrate-binding protein, partial [Planctomycetaceae bacterium]
VLTQRFAIHEEDENRIVYRRAFPESDETAARHVAEIVEKKYASKDKAMQGLLRGEIDVLPHLQTWDVAALAEDDQYFVHKYALPVTHVVQFNPHSRALRSRVLRRALAHAIDRRAILDEVILRGAKNEHGRLTTAPYPRRHDGYNTLVQPREHDWTLAIALAIAARQPLGGEIPELTMVCAPDAVSLAAARRIAEAWRTLGLTINLVADPAAASGDAPPPQWDIVYRTVRMAEPVHELWPFLTLEPAARVASLVHLPDWLRQELVRLDGVSDGRQANARLRELHAHLFAEAQIIPLWEVDDYLAVRKTVRNVPLSPLHAYDGVEQWVVQPWYPTDTP